MIQRPKTPRCGGVENFQTSDTVCRVDLIFFAANSRDILFFTAIFQSIRLLAHTYLNNFESPSIPANSLGRHSGKKAKWSEDRRGHSAHGGGDATPVRSAKNRLALGFIATSDTRVGFRDPARPREVRTDPRALSSLDTAVLEVRPESSPRAPDRRADPRASSLPIQAKRATVWVTRDDRPDQPRRRCARTPNPPPRAPEPRPHPPAASPRLS